MKTLRKNIFAAIAGLALAAGMTGCAHDHHDRDDHHHHRHDRGPGMGAAPGGVSGSADSSALQTQIPKGPRLTEPLRTESVAPGVGSALFPNPDGP